jgi:quercetin dioxygenase-like cupin family protein
MTNFKDYHDYTGSKPDKFFKSTLFQSSNLLLGINCLDLGQSQPVHAHADQDKFYFVLEGEGEFTLGDEKRVVSSGWSVWAQAGVPHGVTNSSSDQLILLVGIAPAPD